MAIQTNFPAIKPSLLLDFANTKQLDPRITFTRASTATFYNGVTTAMAEQNLFTYSQDFSNAAWTKASTTITANSTTAPDGTTTASTVTASGGGIINRVAQTSISGTFMFSFYAKANTQNFIQLNQNASSNYFANFDLSTGTVGTVGSSTTATITSVGSSWYRCTMTVTSATSGVLGLYVIDSSTAAAFATTTSTSNFYIWGAQLEQRSSLTAYTATTTQAITNYIPALQTAASGVARFDNNPTTGESLGLLIEESRTNLQTYSSDFSNAIWNKSNATITADTVVAPDGTLTGDKLVENTTASVNHSVYQQIASQGAGTYTYSIFVKPAGRTQLKIAQTITTAYQLDFELSNLTISGSVGGATGTITSVGNGWYRCSMTFTTVASLTLGMAIYSISGGSVTYTGDGFSGLYLWGAQLEAGAFATSYIPTVASQVTRAADAASMTGTNFSSWFNVGAITTYADFISNGFTANQIIFSYTLSASSIINPIQLYFSAATTLNFDCWGNGTGTKTAAQNTAYKIALGLDVNNLSVTLNADAITSDTSVGPAQPYTQLNIGNRNGSLIFNGTIKKIAYYPLRLTNAQLQALTS